MTSATTALPPGPKTSWFGLSLVGDMMRDPLGTVQEFQKQYGDVLHIRIANETFYYFFSPDLIREVIVEHTDDFIRHERTVDVFAQVYGSNVLTTEGDAWKRQRRILMPGFLPKKIAGYLDLMAAAVADNLSAGFHCGKGQSVEVDVDTFTRRITVDVILRVLFSHKSSESDAVKALEATLALEHQSMRELYWPKTPPDWFPYPGRKEKLQAKAALQNLIGEQIRARRAGGASHASGADYMSMLLSAKDEEAQGASSAATLTDDEIRDNCMVIFAAGHDTTATALTWWLAFMAQHPEYAEKVRQEVESVIGDRHPAAEDFAKLVLLNATLKESLRLYPPAPMLFVRCAGRDFEAGGWHIPKGVNITIPVWSVHRDARWYPEPDKFQPERFLPGAPEIPRGAYLPFGTGPRVCIGQHFAMMEMALIAALLIRQFDFSFANVTEMPKAAVKMMLKPVDDLKIHFTRR